MRIHPVRDSQAHGEIEETGSVILGLLKWMRDGLADGIRSFFGIEETRHSQDVGLDVAFHAAQMANSMRNLYSKANTVSDWVTGPASAFAKLGAGKISAVAGLQTNPLDPHGSLVERGNSIIDRNIGPFPTSSHVYDAVVVRPDGGDFELGSSTARDIDSDGMSEVVGGLSPEEYFLGADLNQDGTIDPATEFISKGMGGLDFRSAEDALASLDANGDGRLDSSDPAFADLYLVGSPAAGIPPITIPLSLSGITAILLDDTTKAAGEALGALGSLLGTSYGLEGAAAALATANLATLREEFQVVASSVADGQSVGGSGGKDLLYAFHSNVTLIGGNGGDVFVSTDPGVAICG